MKKLILALIVMGFVLVACSTTHTVSIKVDEDGTSTFTETATTSMRPVKVE